jgi:hypothetical protein
MADWLDGYAMSWWGRASLASAPPDGAFPPNWCLAIDALAAKLGGEPAAMFFGADSSARP